MYFFPTGLSLVGSHISQGRRVRSYVTETITLSLYSNKYAYILLERDLMEVWFEWGCQIRNESEALCFIVTSRPDAPR